MEVDLQREARHILVDFVLELRQKFQVFDVHPALGVASRPACIDDADRDARFGVDFLRIVICNCAAKSDGLRVDGVPPAIEIFAWLKIRLLFHIVEADIVVVGCLHVLVCAEYGVLRQPAHHGDFHVALPRSQPDLSYHHIVDYHGIVAGDGDGVWTAKFFGGDAGFPFAIGIGLGDSLRTPRAFDGDFFARRRPAPYRAGALLLQHHVVAKDVRKAYISVCRCDRQRDCRHD